MAKQRHVIGFGRVVVGALAAYIFVAHAIMLFLDQPTVDLVTAEDRYFENVGALSLFIASLAFGAAFIVSRRDRLYPRPRRLSYVLLAGMFFFVAGEEISWGQRIFAIQTPQIISDINAKDETNLHNLHVFSSDGTASLPFRFFQVFGFTYLLLIPILTSLSMPLHHQLDRYMAIVHWSIGAIFVANFIWSKVFSSLTYLGQPGEIQESNYEVIFMVVAVHVLHAVLRETGQARAGAAAPKDETRADKLEASPNQ